MAVNVIKIYELEDADIENLCGNVKAVVDIRYAPTFQLRSI